MNTARRNRIESELRAERNESTSDGRPWPTGECVPPHCVRPIPVRNEGDTAIKERKKANQWWHWNGHRKVDTVYQAVATESSFNIFQLSPSHSFLCCKWCSNLTINWIILYVQSSWGGGGGGGGSGCHLSDTGTVTDGPSRDIFVSGGGESSQSLPSTGKEWWWALTGD